MLPKPNDSESQLSKYLAWKDKDEGNPIPKEVIKEEKDDEKPDVDEDGTTIEYFDTKDGDDSTW